MENLPQNIGEKESVSHWHHRELSKRLHGISEGKSLQDLREHVFLSVVFDRFLDTLEEELAEQSWTEEEIQEFFLSLESHDDAQIANAIALPKEIRSNLFSRMREQMRTGKQSPSDLANDLIERNHLHGFTIGYHVSQSEVVPQGDGKWDIHPSELDDRDNMKMAYYSLDYENIYRERSSKFLYLVRGIIGDGTSHKRDGNNNWGRAPFLSIIESISLIDADEIVESVIEEYQKKGASGPRTAGATEY